MYIYIYLYIYIYIYIARCEQKLFILLAVVFLMYLCIYICKYTDIYTYINIYICVSVCVCVCVGVCGCVWCVCVHKSAQYYCIAFISVLLNGRIIRYKYIIVTNRFMCVITVFKLHNMEEDCLMLHLFDH